MLELSLMMALRIMRTLFYGCMTIVFVLAMVPDYSNLPQAFSISDIINHMLAFFVLSFLLDHAYPLSRLSGKLVLLLLFGMLIEVVQYFIPYRHCSFPDWLVDASGVAFYFFVIRRLVRKYIKQQSA